MIKRPTTAKPAGPGLRRLNTHHREEPAPPSVHKSGSKPKLGRSTETGFKKASLKGSSKPVSTLPDKTKKPIKKIGKPKASLTEQDEARRPDTRKTRSRAQEEILPRLTEPDDTELRQRYGNYHYRLEEVYGKGTFGVVYRGEVV